MTTTMKTTTAVATELPQQRTADQPLAAELRDVTVATHRNHRHRMILDAVFLDVRPGEVTTVLSRHDTAASTVLDVLSGRIVPTWGSAQVAGHEVTRLSHRALSQLRNEHLGWVGPGYGVQPRRTVAQNLMVAMRQSGRPVDLDRVELVATTMGLHGMLGYRSATGADARRARWAVARSLVSNPSLVLANDTTAGLDRSEERGLLGALRVAARRLGVGVVLATRDPVTASATDRVVLLSRGRVVDDTGVI